MTTEKLLFQKPNLDLQCVTLEGCWLVNKERALNVFSGKITVPSTSVCPFVIFVSLWNHQWNLTYAEMLTVCCLISFSDGLVIVGVHSAKFPNEKVRFVLFLSFLRSFWGSWSNSCKSSYKYASINLSNAVKWLCSNWHPLRRALRARDLIRNFIRVYKQENHILAAYTNCQNLFSLSV